MLLKMGTLAKGSSGNFSRALGGTFSHFEFESQALGTEFLCAIVSVFLITVTAQLTHNVESGMPFKYSPLLLPCTCSRAVVLVGSAAPLQLKHKGTES